MRSIAAASLLLCLVGCGQPDPPPVTRLEIWAAELEIQIDDHGRGDVQKRSTNQHGRFMLPPARLAALRSRLEPFRRSDEATSASGLREQAVTPCARNYVTDQGAVTIHWAGAGLDRWYSIDFGCDPATHAARNAALRSILASLPVPAGERLQ